MGAVDLVVQVESPPSVAQRPAAGRPRRPPGRRGVSRGVVFPKYRGDLVQAAVVAERMRAGAIEALRVPRNPLDVLAQQIVAMVAMDDWDGRRPARAACAAPRRSPRCRSRRSTRCSTCSPGRYPSDAFAELRPRLVWDRVTGTLTGRPGAQRLAVTSGGTIPDRGLFGVFLVGGDGREQGGRARRRARRGDGLRVAGRRRVHARLDVLADRGHHRTTASWSPRRPGCRAGCRSGRATRSGGPPSSAAPSARSSASSPALPTSAARARLRGAGLDAWAADNLLAYLREQQAATGHVPDDRTIVVERFRDELGDWRVVVHSPVRRPGARAVGARARRPAARAVRRRRPGHARRRRHRAAAARHRRRCSTPTRRAARGRRRCSCSTPTRSSRSSPPRSAGRRCSPPGSASAPPAPCCCPAATRAGAPRCGSSGSAPRSCSSVASEYGSFPIVLETMRECLQDVFDVPALVDADAGHRRRARSASSRSTTHRAVAVRPLAAVRLRRRSSCTRATPRWPSGGPPRSRSTPRCSPSCSARPSCASCSTRTPWRVEAELQRLTEDRRATRRSRASPTCCACSARSPTEATRARRDAALAARAGGRPPRDPGPDRRRRALGRRRGRRAAARRARRCRCRSGSPRRSSSRWPTRSATWSPATPARTARSAGRRRRAGSGSGVAVVDGRAGAARAPAASSRASSARAAPGTEWCDAEVLRQLRRRSLAALRQEAEPVPPVALARFLPAWQHVGPHAARPRRRAARRRAAAGRAVPASALETLVLPARVRGYSPALLDELTAAGRGGLGRPRRAARRRRLGLAAPGRAGAGHAPAGRRAVRPVRRCRRRCSTPLGDGRALFFRALADRVGQAMGVGRRRRRCSPRRCGTWSGPAG